MDLAAKLLCAAAAAIYAIGSPPLQAQPTSVLNAQVAAYTDPDPAPFFIRGLSNKCIDAGVPQARFAGQPVVVSDCNRTPAQQIDIVEISADHRVVLKASDYCLGPKGGVLNIGVQLELQLCDSTAALQQFVIDGDSIISLASIPINVPARHRLVLSVSGGKFANGSSLVLIERTLDDAEFWSFGPAYGPLSGNLGTSAPLIGQTRPITNIPAGGFRQKPTTGFIMVKTLPEFAHALAPAGVPAAPGTVIELAADIALEGITSAGLIVPDRVTIRGGRHALQPGFAIVYPSDFSLRDPIFIVQGADARITGVRIIGPSRDTDPDLPRLNGILVLQDPNSMPPASRTIIDHNELSQFTNASIRVEGGPDAFGDFCLGPRDYHLRPPNVEIVRNFIHDNRSQGEGYGVEVAGGAHAVIEANTFDDNRHAIAATFDGRNEYYAYGNLVMPNAPRQEIASYLKIAKALLAIGLIPGLDLAPDNWYTHDFDVHGSGDGNTIDFEDGLVPPHAGGEAGKNFEFAANTFLQNNRETLDLRGTPCLGAAYYGNITRRSQGDAVTDRSNGNIIRYWGNQFSHADPQLTVASGDFDGDGKPDLFMATGAAWYYKPNGTLEWRFLNYSTLTLDQITLQDVDGDGRTDAVYQIGNQIFTSWGARSPAKVTATLPEPPQTPPHDPRRPPRGEEP